MCTRKSLIFRFILFLFFLFIANAFSYAQYKRPKFPINDEWSEKYGDKGLKIGDKLPDIPLGKVINNNTGKTRFSEFKGKLVILDFWATSCISCIKAFPKMQALQNEFGDKIQIFLVNPWESEEQIKSRLSPAMAKMIPELPSIVAESSHEYSEQKWVTHPLFKLFPTRTTGQYVWIDPQGFIKAIADGSINYSKKVQQVLSGMNVPVVHFAGALPTISADPKATYYQLLGSLQKTPLLFGSFITSYNNEIAGFSNTLVDTVAKTKTRYYINTELLDLYLISLSTKNMNENLAYSPNHLLDYLIFPNGIDTLQFTTREDIVSRAYFTDLENIRSKYCYEQIVTMDLPEAEQNEYMFDDLNQFFGRHNRVQVELQKRKVPCYVITSNSGKNLLSSEKVSFRDTINNLNGEKFIRFQQYSLSDILKEIIEMSGTFRDTLLSNKIDGKPFCIINRSRWPKHQKLNMTIPMSRVDTMEDLRRILLRQGLDIVQREEEIDFIVFTCADLIKKYESR